MKFFTLKWMKKWIGNNFNKTEFYGASDMHCANVLFSRQFNTVLSNDRNARLLLIKNIVDNACYFQFLGDSNKKKEITLPVNWAGMIWFFRGSLVRIAGNFDYYLIDLMRLAKLQAFIDVVFTSQPGLYRKTPFFSVFAMPQVDQITSFQQIEYWYMSQVYSPVESHTQIIPFIRATEWYQLVSFLIKESHSDEVNIQQLSKKYGLSNSYFRYLCKQVLGGTLKGQISDWRLASALIDMVKLRLSATDVAYKAGYSSLSHFSKEVKKTMGHSTRDLKKLY